MPREKAASEGRIGNWMTTASGRYFWPLDPRAPEVCIDDIAHALSHVCRFGGHCSRFYSVAQHSVLVAHLVERTNLPLALHALLHDAGEAYLGDHIHPVKSALRVLRNAIDESIGRTEWRIMRAIDEAFGLRELSADEAAIIKHADAVLLATEARDLMGDPKWPGLPPAETETIDPIGPGAACAVFRRAFQRLSERAARGTHAS